MKDLVLVALPNPNLSNPKMYFALGILYLAAVVKKAGYDVEIVDMRDGAKELPGAKFYGFSCTTPEIPAAKALAKIVKGKTIVGGAHPSVAPSDCTEFDYTVVGEGEDIILDIVGGKLDPTTYSTERKQNLNDIPYPAWDLVDAFSPELFPGERYGQIGKGMTVICSRGCPYDCSFCGNLFRKPIVYRSTENIIGEVEELQKRGVEYVRFEDDNFTIHPDFDNLCLDLRYLGVHWKCHTRSRLLRLPQVEMMKWAGCEECGLGVESADDTVLEINNKKETRTDHVRAVELLHRGGLRAKTYFIAGLPGETDGTVAINKDFFRQVKPDKWTLSTFTPYPGCDVYRNPKRYNITIDDWNYNNWWNFVEKGFVHTLVDQTPKQMWDRYKGFYQWLVEGKWL